MKYCQQCGTKNGDERTICFACGFEHLPKTDGRQVDIVIEHPYKSGLVVWTDEGMTEIISNIPGVSRCQKSDTERTKYYVYIDPRFNSEIVESAINITILKELDNRANPILFVVKCDDLPHDAVCTILEYSIIRAKEMFDSGVTNYVVIHKNIINEINETILDHNLKQIRLGQKTDTPAMIIFRQQMRKALKKNAVYSRVYYPD